MSEKENKTLPVALLVTGIVCIMILSCCFVWLVVRCERWRRRRKYRPKHTNRYKINASHIANGQELKDLEPRHLNPSVNLIHYASKNSVTSQSIPSLLSADSMDDSIASEPLYARNYGEDEPDSDYLPARDLSIARILGSFPELKFYPPSASSSAENVLDAKNDKPPIPIPRPRASATETVPKSKDFSINSSLYTDCNSKASIDSFKGSAKSGSSAESLGVQMPGGKLKIHDISGNFEFTKVKSRKDKSSSLLNDSETNPQMKVPRIVLETEV
ncbi:hypothetical protein Ocin01_05749 [Orchesella cincta]|uniref:Uncharacterized protein n=1 Tax=Orchesella cincta TaxID=48709 RepID=A0A1D2N6Q8_ORCCI|nr:hypothetical protein Ocin01_05749 [Orchesella cincta]